MLDRIVILQPLAVTVLLVVVASAFRFFWRRPSRSRRICVNLSISLFSVLYSFVLLEIVFSSFFIYSDATGFTLSAKRWKEKYWGPINSLGYRDYEHSESDLREKNVLLVVGDSFVAGHGIRHVSARFPNLLGEMAGDRWTVVVVAKNGWDTRKEHDAIASYPLTPKRILLSYYYNDIEGACRESGLQRPKRKIPKPQSRLGRLAVDHSYLVNFSYWRLYRWEDLAGGFWSYRVRCFSDDDVWSTHAKDLLKIVGQAQERKSEIAFVVWPKLDKMVESQELTARVVELLESRGVEVLDLGELFAGRDPGELIVNRMDPHPNARTHAEVAKALYHWLEPWS